MTAWWIAVAVWTLSGLAGLAGRKGDRVSSWGLVVGCVAAAVSALTVLLSGHGWSWTCAWSVPDGQLALGLDPLSAFFLLPLAVVAALATPAGQGDARALSRGRHWFWLNVLVLSMALVLTARHALLFLVAWEGMTLASYFLVVSEHEQAEVREAGWTYLVAAHIGLAFLLAFFLLLGRQGGTLEFGGLAVPGRVLPGAGVLFVLALAGFGLKAGLVPLHVWLPEAHPAAPSHVSALLSGVMLKLGLYGLLRSLTFFGPMQAGWGYTLLGLGALSALWGAAAALAQDDFKRLLAYSSVENIGLITLGLGLGCLAGAQGQPALAALGFAGALLHIWNHALFKSLLFIGAGAVVHAAHERRMDRLGGLLKVMPVTGTAFLIGALALAALPPLNGLVGEALLYAAGFIGGLQPAARAWPYLTAALVLSVAGALAVVVAARSFGVVFLGEPRAPHSEPVHEAALATRGSLWLLAAACVLTGLAGPWLLLVPSPVLASLVGGTQTQAADALRVYQPLLLGVSGLGLSAALLAAGLWGWRRRRLARQGVRHAPTWDCGYHAPSPRMQYTGASLVEPLRAGLNPAMPVIRARVLPQGWFPRSAGLSSRVPDVFRTYFFEPLFRRGASVLAWLRWIQHGRIQVYVLYIALALLLLLIWKLRWA